MRSTATVLDHWGIHRAGVTAGRRRENYPRDNDALEGSAAIPECFTTLNARTAS